jgi:hypothetical protein
MPHNFREVRLHWCLTDPKLLIYEHVCAANKNPLQIIDLQGIMCLLCDLAGTVTFYDAFYFQLIIFKLYIKHIFICLFVAA